jgi:ribosomal-protein-serine acetyltransferase
LISYGFTHYALHKIKIRCAAGNTRSRAVAERLGFTQEGVLRQSQLLNGQYIDIVLYGMLKSEWEK